MTSTKAAAPPLSKDSAMAGDGSFESLQAAFADRHPGRDLALIRRAFETAELVHRNQTRLSGEQFITHPVSVARIVTDLGLDDISVAAALLHDTIEDTELTLADLERDFGVHVSSLVDSLTKLDRLSFDSKEAQQAATMRKLLMAMAKDWRVLVIKLADRLHNMRTSSFLPEWKRQRLAQETLDIYAPLAHRLGIQEVKWQLEDLCFEILRPGPYGEISDLVERRAPERELYLQGVIHAAKARLKEAGISGEVSGRPKNHWSIYEKMVVKGKEFNEIFDLVGIRIIVDTDRDCWAALGAIHGLWSPVHGRFKDYINSPKFNLYQSIHTTVMGPGGKALEVQIRTWEMHRTAEYGVAAHWGYKEGSTPSEIAWLQRIVDWQSETPDPNEFLESLRLDLEQDEVYVFTPKGKVITLPAGSTPIDFAYAIHTDVGHRCIGAKVNEKLVPLDTQLYSGQTVDILTSKSETAGPSQDWSSVVRSARARSKIRQWF
ncbi:MAG TPA: bifunctional (p)ppGpp synthetase/guanosine-3',5'-bis(diphosphate) 3'-pyrophosphohydrolase, partial [Acidimicrobiales bacterium]|nr:bifunctional (p)ppGpp synthetase/guanosine-3',5'-bis(diphosphate) 3'-pyrophosphohydrolase [Acidimicrobiales bacterium]